jgi:hypothetical protein
MKLTNEQIDLINRYLEQQNLMFLDVKVELMDHLCCEIEQEMTDNDTPFESAASMVFERWQPELQIKKSWLIGLENSFPKLVVTNLFKKVLFHYGFVTLTVLIVGVLSITRDLFLISDSVFSAYEILIVAFTIVYLWMKRKMNQTKIKTTYSFQYDYFYFPVSFIIIYLLVLDSVAIKTLLLLLFTINLPFACYFYFKHFQTLKKFKYEN